MPIHTFRYCIFSSLDSAYSEWHTLKIDWDRRIPMRAYRNEILLVILCMNNQAMCVISLKVILVLALVLTCSLSS